MPPRLPLRSTCHAYRHIIGLTGSIASGKSHAREVLASLGAVTVDADRLGHAAYRRGTPCYDAVIKEFSPAVVGADGEIDRAALGGIVFADRSRMHALNAIVWPAIEALIEQALNDAADSAPAACDAAGDASAPGAGLIGVVEAAVLLEAGWADRVDSVWVTWAPEEDIIARLQQRNGLSQEAARARIALQMPLADRLARADAAFDTRGSKADTRCALEADWAALQL